MNNQLTYRIAFSQLRGITPQLAQEILAKTGSEDEFFRLSQSALSAAMGLRSRLFDESYRAGLVDKASKEIGFIESSGIETIYFTDPDYPGALTECSDAPLMLYSLGQAPLDSATPMLSIVGTRHATPYGLDFVERLIADIAEKVATPVTIISGLAFGIDIAAHKAALRHGLPTIAVLAHGLNMIYPAQHRTVAADIVRSGGRLVTEYTSQCAVHKGNFVARNRIVAGMSHALIVAESARKGGALITARLAADYDRDVFALPGRTSDRYSAGCNALIADNTASLITCADDLIKAMNWPEKTTAASQPSLFPDLTDEEKSILEFLTSKGEAMINSISVNLNIAIGRLMSILIDMEFKGLIIKYPGGKYRLK